MHIYCFAHTKPFINYLGIKFKLATEITIIHDQSAEDRIERYILQKYMQNNGYKSVNFKAVNYLSASEMQLLYKDINNDALMILPPIELAKHLNVYRTLPTEKFQSLFIENDGDIFSVNAEGIKEFMEDDVKLSVKDFIHQTRGNIIGTNNALFNQQAANELLAYFIKHLDLMKSIMKFKKPLIKNVDPNYAYNNPFNNPYSTLTMSKLDNKEKPIYLGALAILESHQVIQINRQNIDWVVKFNDLGYRDYFAKAGTWLEHYTFNALKKVQGIRDVNSSVMFVWDDQYNAVRNELDVMAITDNQLITISCKDTTKIDDDYLYELESHATQLATEEAIKIIVTTSQPNTIITERAKQLGIAIIIYDGIESHFLSDLHQAIQ